MSRRLKKILKLDYPDRERKIQEYAQELGIPSNADFNGNQHYEMLRRVLEVGRSHRESRLWIIALLSAIAAIVSALAAWFAVLK